ncbi:Ff.00g036990.m01.CDS01 [Fusarium sp. VM40]|nr:Ff.00g036990.m01.CDS01 [Fusarium sp. VM40]
MKQLHITEYTFGWICALPEEFLAAQSFLDEDHGQPTFRLPRDTNSYWLGAIGKHNIVMAVLPRGDDGTASAAAVATNLLRSFPNVKYGVMVGVGGGAPQLPDHDIRLGDVVVSSPGNGHSGVFQYDFGKYIQDKKYQYTRSLSQPPQALLTAMAGLQTYYEKNGNGLLEAVDEILKNQPGLRKKYGRPSPDTDVLFKSNVVHGDDPCASTCGMYPANTIPRPERERGIDDECAIHYGTIASGNSVMRDAVLRDRLAVGSKALCFEMQAAGLMNIFPCLVVRGICNYADTHSSKEWRGYAAMVAAAYARDLIRYLAPELVSLGQNANSISDIQGAHVESSAVVTGSEPRRLGQGERVTQSWLVYRDSGAQQIDISREDSNILANRR